MLDDWYTQSGNEDTTWNGGRGPGERARREDRDEQKRGRQGEEGQQGMTPHNDTHPQVMEMMWEYYKQFDYIMGRQICHKAGIRIQDLKLGRACLNFILGGCNKEGCTERRVSREKQKV